MGAGRWVVVLVLLSAMAGCLWTDSPEAPADKCAGKSVAPLEVSVKDNSFDTGGKLPETCSPLHFKNLGTARHTVTFHVSGAPTGQYLADHEMAPGADTTVAYPGKGTYHIFCRYHSDGASGNYESGQRKMVMTLFLEGG